MNTITEKLSMNYRLNSTYDNEFCISAKFLDTVDAHIAEYCVKKSGNNCMLCFSQQYHGMNFLSSVQKAFN